VHTGYEFGYTMLAIYFSHMIYSRLYLDSMRLQSVHKFLKVPIDSVNYLLGQILFLYLTFLPTLLYHFLYDILKEAILAFGLNEYPTLKFIFIFLVCYYIIHVFLDKMCEMFLQIFEFKASAFTYVMIVFAWFVRTLSIVPISIAQLIKRGPVAATIPTELELLAKSNGLYIFVLLIHLALSLLLAPLCQLVSVLYMAYAFFGNPFALWNFRSDDSFISYVGKECKKSSDLNKDEILGGFDNFAYLYGYRYGFSFIMMLFFFFKTIQCAVEMKTLALRTAVTTINAYITATMAVIYFVHVYYKNVYSAHPIANPDTQSQPPPAATTPADNSLPAGADSLSNVSKVVSQLSSSELLPPRVFNR